jgi:hypothetical protein
MTRACSPHRGENVGFFHFLSGKDGLSLAPKPFRVASRTINIDRWGKRGFFVAGDIPKAPKSCLQ